MSEQKEFEGLVEASREGSQSDLNELLKQVEPELKAYFYRCTLNRDLTEDLVQETMMQAAKSIEKLRNDSSFRPWLFTIASSKLKQFFREKKRTQVVNYTTINEGLLENVPERNAHTPESGIAKAELTRTIFEAVSNLKEGQREIVTLRCYESMSFAEIGQTVGCSEGDARVSFFRAKQSLMKHLKKNGFSKASLLGALVIFGKATSPSKAAADSLTVAPQMLSVADIGIGAGIVSTVWFKLTALFVVMGSGFGVLLHEPVLPARSDVKSVYFTIQGIEPKRNILSMRRGAPSYFENTSGSFYQSKGAYENWMYFPEGPDGPVIRRMQRWSIDKEKKLCSWLQDGKDYIYYDSAGKVIHKSNCPTPLLVMPVDKPDVVHYSLNCFESAPKANYRWDRSSGVLRSIRDDRIPTISFKTEYKYNSLNMDDFKWFWPEGAKIQDDRDTMHRRGWTYFKIEGSVLGTPVSGYGRVPFTYEMSKQIKPFLKMQAGSAVYCDHNEVAYIQEQSGKITAAYPGGSFFKGLGRPWFGIRALDCVRRDGAELKYKMTAEIGDSNAVVIVQEPKSDCVLRYWMDMERDVIERIDIKIQGSRTHDYIRFEYMQEMPDTAAEQYPEPEQVQIENSQLKAKPGMKWIFDLCGTP